MTTDELCKKIDYVLVKCELIKNLSLKIIKDVIDDPQVADREKIIYRLEYQHRVKGTPESHLIILSKMQADYTDFDIAIAKNVLVTKR